MAKVTWTLFAREDLKSIYDYIARDSNYYAKQFTEKIVGRIEVLENHPELGRVVPEFEKPNIREIIEGKYRIIYQLSNDSVEIIRIHHSSRELK